jgi:hypothetical protein
MEWCLKSHDDFHWLYKTIGFDLASLVKLEFKLENNMLRIECLFHKVLEFVIEDYECCNVCGNGIFHCDSLRCMIKYCRKQNKYTTWRRIYGFVEQGIW